MKRKPFKQETIRILSGLILCAVLCVAGMAAGAVSYPSFNLVFDPTDESVIVEGIPAASADGTVEYQLEGYLNYGRERIETFCYGPNVVPYDIPANMAYLFNWGGDKERFLPCTGTYQFTAYITARYQDSNGKRTESSGPKATITFDLHKKDESTNWGPGLPNTTVESYDIGQIKGKDKTIRVEEEKYIWTIYGKDIETVPAKNISLKITPDPKDFDDTGVDAFFGDTVAERFNIEHSGEFGFKAKLTYKIGAEYSGKYAHLFYVAGSGEFEHMGSCLVDEKGEALFEFTHASDYILAVTGEEEYTGGAMNAPAAGSESGGETSSNDTPVSEEKADTPAVGTPGTAQKPSEESKPSEGGKPSAEAQPSAGEENSPAAQSSSAGEQVSGEKPSADKQAGEKKEEASSAETGPITTIGAAPDKSPVWIAVVGAVLVVGVTVCILMKKKK